MWDIRASCTYICIYFCFIISYFSQLLVVDLYFYRFQWTRIYLYAFESPYVWWCVCGHNAHEICAFMEHLMSQAAVVVVDRVLSSRMICADVYKSVYLYIQHFTLVHFSSLLFYFSCARFCSVSFSLHRSSSYAALAVL